MGNTVLSSGFELAQVDELVIIVEDNNAETLKVIFYRYYFQKNERKNLNQMVHSVWPYW